MREGRGGMLSCSDVLNAVVLLLLIHARVNRLPPYSKSHLDLS